MSNDTNNGTKGLNGGSSYTPWSTPDGSAAEIVLPERIGSPGKEGPAIAAITFPTAGGIQTNEGNHASKPFGLHPIIYHGEEPV